MPAISLTGLRVIRRPSGYVFRPSSTGNDALPVQVTPALLGCHPSWTIRPFGSWLKVCDAYQVDGGNAAPETPHSIRCWVVESATKSPFASSDPITYSPL